MSSEEERDYIKHVLGPEVIRHFAAVAKEYRQPRRLGLRGEFAAVFRKVEKLKTVLWDGESDKEWREGRRVIGLEVVAHGLLMLCDMDKEEGLFEKRLKEALGQLGARAPESQKIDREEEHDYMGITHDPHPGVSCKRHEQGYRVSNA